MAQTVLSPQERHCLRVGWVKHGRPIVRNPSVFTDLRLQVLLLF